MRSGEWRQGHKLRKALRTPTLYDGNRAPTTIPGTERALFLPLFSLVLLNSQNSLLTQTRQEKRTTNNLLKVRLLPNGRAKDAYPRPRCRSLKPRLLQVRIGRPSNRVPPAVLQGGRKAVLCERAVRKCCRKIFTSLLDPGAACSVVP